MYYIKITLTAFRGMKNQTKPNRERLIGQKRKLQNVGVILELILEKDSVPSYRIPLLGSEIKDYASLGLE